MQTQTTFVQLAAEGASAEAITAVAISEWRMLDIALLPIIGRRGLVAIYKRALNLVRINYPGLVRVLDGDSAFVDFASLQSILATQTGALAVVANLAFYQCFRTLLASLIGTNLCERLLKSIHNASGGRVLERRKMCREAILLQAG